MRRIQRPSGTSLEDLPRGAARGARPPAAREDTLPIDKDIPLPERRTRGTLVRETLLNMEVGDSFFLPGKSPGTGVAKLARGLKMKVVRREVEGGVRIWRYE